MNNMNPFEKIPPSEIQFFKEKVQHWLQVDNQISEIEKTLRELKKVRNKELEPEITNFMTKHNVYFTITVGKEIFRLAKTFDDVQMIPESFLYNKEGFFIEKFIGEIKKSKLETYIKESIEL